MKHFVALQGFLLVMLVALVALATPPGASSVAHRPAGVAGRVGYGVGLASGVAVTGALRVVPSWNRRVLDAHGQPVTHVPGATRIGEHPILERHREVVGPQINAQASRMQPGLLRRFVAGVGAGATRAPGATYRLEAHASDALHHATHGR